MNNRCIHTIPERSSAPKGNTAHPWMGCIEDSVIQSNAWLTTGHQVGIDIPANLG